MKYVYVLVSSENDLYYEQALMSVVSFRLYMPEADVVLLTDDKTAAGFTGTRAMLSGLVTQVVAVPFDAQVRNVERSRLIKTAIPEYVSGDFLYIDCDTIICGDLSDIADTHIYPMELGGVLDCHVSLDEHIHKNYFLQRDKALGFSGTKALNGNFNGGLLLARDTETTRALFREWNSAWKFSAYQKHDLHDQSALNEANYRIGLKIQQLPGEWNCQPCHGGLFYLGNAKILHYFSSEFKSAQYMPYYKLADKALQMRIKESGSIPDDILDMIKHPQFQFGKVHLVSDRRIVDIMQSPLLFTLADMKAHCYPLFKVLEATAAGIRTLAKKISSKR